MENIVSNDRIKIINETIICINKSLANGDYASVLDKSSEIIHDHIDFIDRNTAERVAKVIFHVLINNVSKNIDGAISTSDMIICIRMCIFLIKDCHTLLDDNDILAVENIIINIGSVHSNSLPGEGRDHLAALAALRELFNHKKNMTTGFHLSQLHLALCQYDQAWSREDYLQTIAGSRYWDGKPCNSLMIVNKWGMGDIIIFMRYIPIIKNFVDKIYLCVERRFGEFVKSFNNSSMFTVVNDASSVEVDAVIDDFTIPKALGLGAAHFKPVPSYFTLDPQEVANWRRVVRKSDALHVGLVWASGNGRSDKRTVGFNAVSRLLHHRDVVFVGLQVNKEEIFSYRLPDNFVDFGLFDIKNTALAMSTLDVVVSTCSGTAQISSALGIPTFIMLRRNSAWLWQGEDWRNEQRPCSLHQSARLFRQREEGHWDSVIDNISATIGQMKRG